MSIFGLNTGIGGQFYANHLITQQASRGIQDAATAIATGFKYNHAYQNPTAVSSAMSAKTDSIGYKASYDANEIKKGNLTPVMDAYDNLLNAYGTMVEAAEEMKLNLGDATALAASTAKYDSAILTATDIVANTEFEGEAVLSTAGTNTATFGVNKNGDQYTVNFVDLQTALTAIDALPVATAANLDAVIAAVETEIENTASASSGAKAAYDILDMNNGISSSAITANGNKVQILVGADESEEAAKLAGYQNRASSVAAANNYTVQAMYNSTINFTI